MDNMKICKRCKRELPADLIHFNKCGSAWDGLRWECKECRGGKFRAPYNYGVNEETEKKCSACQTVYPKTEEFFSWNDKEHKHFSARCKKCVAKKNRESTKRKEYYKEYLRKHPDVEIKRQLRRYEHIAQNENTLTSEQYAETLERFNNSCAYCGERGRLSSDHIIPVTKGGGTTKENMIPACIRCNGSKGSKDFTEWYRAQPFYSPEREAEILKHMRGE